MIKLDSNENQLKHNIDINKIVTEIDPRKYPNVTKSEIKQALSEKYGVHFNETFCSNGSDNLIKVLTFCLVHHNEDVIIPEVAFPTYEIAAKMKECEYTLIPLKDNGIDLEATLKAIKDNTRLIWLSNPHNPTGTLFTTKEIEEFIKKVPSDIVVVLDEAYIEFALENTLESIDIYHKFDNVIILRTFSKAYGLAGARMGYGFAKENLIEKIKLGLGPFDVTDYAQNLALAMLEDQEYVKTARKINNEELEKYELACKELNIEYIKSFASFIMIKMNDNTDSYCDFLKDHDIIVKNGKLIGMPGWVRISMGDKNQNNKIINLTKLFY